MSFLYPRKVKFYRPQGNSAVGAVPYQGATPTKEDVLFSAKQFEAGVQWRSGGGLPPTKLPADSAKIGYWEVLVIGLGPGDVRNCDIAVDELGNRFQIFDDYITPLNAQLKCQRLEA